MRGINDVSKRNEGSDATIFSFSSHDDMHLSVHSYLSANLSIQ